MNLFKRISAMVILVLFVSLVQFTPGQGRSACFSISNLDVDGETIVISNSCTESFDISHFKILSVDHDKPSEVEQVFRFPANCELGGESTLTVFSGAASKNLANNNDECWNTENANTEIEMYWDVSGADGNVWRNDGDIACLINGNRLTIAGRSVFSTERCLESY